SYQCAFVDASPRVAVVTNLYQDHLPWHGGADQYWVDKARIFTHGAEALVCDVPTERTLKSAGLLGPASGPHVVVVPEDGPISGVPTSVSLDSADLPEALRAPHMVRNLRLALAAAAVVAPDALTPSVVRDALAHWHALEHRLQVVSQAHG